MEVHIAAGSASYEAAAEVAASYVANSPLLLLQSSVSDVCVLFNADALTTNAVVAAAPAVVAVAAVVAATAGLQKLLHQTSLVLSKLSSLLLLLQKCRYIY